MEPTSAEDVQRLVQELGATIRRTLSESPQVARCFSRIRAEGYEVSLVLEATIGFHRVGSRDPQEVSRFDVRMEKNETAPIKMTPLDKKFLRSLKIRTEEDGD